MLPSQSILAKLATTIRLIKDFLIQWAWKLPILRSTRLNLAYTEFEAEALKLIHQRRQEQQQGIHRPDLLARLIKQTDSESPNDQLTLQELIANIHIFLAGGHETTAFAFSVALMFLAMYPVHQDAIADEARRVFGSAGEAPGYDKFPELVSTSTAQLIRLMSKKS